MKQKARKTKLRWDRIIICIILVTLTTYGLVSLVKDVTSVLMGSNKELVYEGVVVRESNKQTPQVVQTSEKQEEIVPEIEPVGISYRLTSYYTNDSTNSGTCTGSGLCTKDFQINDKGWYTYQGKLVLAGATNACLNSTNSSDACSKYNSKVEGRIYFNYYDTITIVIDDITYEGIILDSCGASMFVEEERLDLFVANKESAIDRGYKGNNTITVFSEIQ